VRQETPCRRGESPAAPRVARDDEIGDAFAARRNEFRRSPEYPSCKSFSSISGSKVFALRAKSAMGKRSFRNYPCLDVRRVGPSRKVPQSVFVKCTQG